MLGMHERIGDKVRQDKTVKLEVAHKLIKGLEEEFLGSKMDI